MSLFREIPPTAGLAFHFKDLFYRDNRPLSLEDNLRKYLELAFIRITCSGTAALYIILNVIKKISPKRSVIIPSYVCPLVALAVKRAGLNIIVCDIGQENFNFQSSQFKEICLKNKDILAAIPVYLAGLPFDTELIQGLSKEEKFFIIEDCAQSMGAEYNHSKLGKFGDFSFFSLCRGKGLTIYEGGLIATKEEKYAALLDETLGQVIKNRFSYESLKVIELFGYWLFYRPQLFWYVYRLPQFFWRIKGRSFKAETEEFNLDFELYKVSGLRKNLGNLSFYRLEEEIEYQREKAAYYLRRLEEITDLKVIAEDKNSRSNYPYLTLLFSDQNKRNRVLYDSLARSLGVSRIYAAAISDYPYLKGIVPEGSYPHAQGFVERSLTLSTNNFLKEKDMDKVINLIKNVN